MESHVVTITLGFGSLYEVHELFRGDESECRHLSTAITCCSDDQRPIDSVRVGWGPIEDWEKHLSCMLRAFGEPKA